jgi:hypothetical protein
MSAPGLFSAYQFAASGSTQLGAPWQLVTPVNCLTSPCTITTSSTLTIYTGSDATPTAVLPQCTSGSATNMIIMFKNYSSIAASVTVSVSGGGDIDASTTDVVLSKKARQYFCDSNITGKWIIVGGF